MNTNIETVATEDTATVMQNDEKVYVFRTLQATDVFLMFKILGKIGINEFAESFGKESVQKMITGLTNEDGVANLAKTAGIAVTLEVANVILGNLPRCEQEIFQMLSNTSNLSVKQVERLDFPTFTEMVIDFIKKPEFRDFIKVVSKLFG
jgi:hypothetical protein